jgi:hypothetical protein
MRARHSLGLGTSLVICGMCKHNSAHESTLVVETAIFLRSTTVGFTMVYSDFPQNLVFGTSDSGRPQFSLPAPLHMKPVIISTFKTVVFS